MDFAERRGKILARHHDRDILIAAVDGLVGFAEAIAAVFPKTEVQRCIVHPVINQLSIEFEGWLPV